MKVGSFVLMILMVGLIFTIFGSVMNDFQTQYANYTTVSNSSWSGIYNNTFTDMINATASDMAANLNELSDDDAWYENLGEGIITIPLVILQTAVILLLSLGFGISIFINAGGKYLPSEVLAFGVVALIVIIVFALINWWHSKAQA